MAPPDITATVANSASGLELAEGGFVEDVEIATELDTSLAVPILAHGAFKQVAVQVGDSCGGYSNQGNPQPGSQDDDGGQ